MNPAFLWGPWLNAAAFAAAISWIAFRQPLSAERSEGLRRFLGALAVVAGLRMVWNSVGGTPGHTLLQILYALLALSIGNVVGGWLRFQEGFRRLHQFAVSPGVNAHGTARTGLIFLANPLSFIAPFHEGLAGDLGFIGVKCLMDGLNAVAWRGPRGALGVAMLTMTLLNLALGLLGQWLGPRVGIVSVDAMNAAQGMILATSSLMVLQLRKVPLGNYLAAVPLAVLFSRWLR